MSARLVTRRLGALRLALVVGGLGLACGTTREPPPGPPPAAPRGLTSLAGLPGVECGTPLAVIVELADGQRFCIDRFEANVDGQSLGNVHQSGGDDTLDDLDGSTLGTADVALGVTPASGLSFYQAKAACLNAGKRLCTQQEWERACRGPTQLVYPYGDTAEEALCNGFYAFLGLQRTGGLATCGSAYGAFDLSGNLEEWVDAKAERIAGSGVFADRLIRGGSFRGNANALACTGSEFHVPPSSIDDDRGFRCCSAVPSGL